MITLHDIMSVDVITVNANSTLREVAELLSAEHITGAPVMRGDRVVGVISATDLLGFDADARAVPTVREEGRAGWDEEDPGEEWREGEESVSAFFVDQWDNVGADVTARFASPDGPEWDVLEEHTADEIMTRPLVHLPPDTELQEAARYMLRTGVSRLLVMEEGRLLGVVTTTDFVKAVAQHGVAG